MSVAAPEVGRSNILIVDDDEGVTVTFAALLELLREQLIDIVQAEPYQPLHVRRAVRDPDASALEGVEITTA